MRHLTEGKSRCQGRNARGNLNEVTAGPSHHNPWPESASSCSKRSALIEVLIVLLIMRCWSYL